MKVLVPRCVAITLALSYPLCVTTSPHRGFNQLGQGLFPGGTGPFFFCHRFQLRVWTSKIGSQQAAVVVLNPLLRYVDRGSAGVSAFNNFVFDLERELVMHQR